MTALTSTGDHIFGDNSLTTHGIFPYAVGELCPSAEPVLVPVVPTLRLTSTGEHIFGDNPLTTRGIYPYAIGELCPAGVAPPVALVVSTSHPPGSYSQLLSLELSVNKTAMIYYSLNGAEFILYSGPISILYTTSLRFYAIDTALNTSDIVTYVYNMDVVQTTASLMSGYYTSVQSLVLTSEGQIQYSINAGPANVYSEPLVISTSQTINYWTAEEPHRTLTFDIDLVPLQADPLPRSGSYRQLTLVFSANKEFEVSVNGVVCPSKTYAISGSQDLTIVYTSGTRSVTVTKTYTADPSLRFVSITPAPYPIQTPPITVQMSTQLEGQIEYSVNDSDFIPYTEPLILSSIYSNIKARLCYADDNTYSEIDGVSYAIEDTKNRWVTLG